MNAPISAPAGFPRGAWTAYTPTITAGAGTFTSVSGAGRFLRVGKTGFFTVKITCTTNGSAASFVICPLPSGWTAAGGTPGYMVSGIREDGLVVWGSLSPGATNVNIGLYTGVYPLSDGHNLTLTGVVELA